MAKAQAGGENFKGSKNNTSIPAVAEDDCFSQFSRSELVFIELTAQLRQKRESIAMGEACCIMQFL
jgi:hypothetical protein